MVHLFLTTRSWDATWKVKRQLIESNIAAPESIEVEQDGKIFFETSVQLLCERVVCLSLVERVFLCLHSEPLSDDHPLCRDGPSYRLLQDWVQRIDWSAVFSVIDVVYGGRRPKAWTVDATRRGPKGSRIRAFERLAMHQSVRDVLRGILSAYGLEQSASDAGLMVYIFLSSSSGLVAVPVLQRRVREGYFPHKGLHHSLCWGLARVARLQPGDVVLDPMAGKGVTLLEAAAFWPACRYIGCELNLDQLSQAQENLEYATTRGVMPFPGAVGLMWADCRRLPFSTGSIDVAISDLPYGRLYGSEEGNKDLYAAALAELSRLLKPKTGRAVLITTATPANKAAMECGVAACAGRLRIERAVQFRFGGNRDRVAMIMYCITSAGGSADWFDWSCTANMDPQGELNWKAIKPLLEVYSPPRVVAAAVARGDSRVSCSASAGALAAAPAGVALRKADRAPVVRSGASREHSAAGCNTWTVATPCTDELSVAIECMSRLK